MKKLIASLGIVATVAGVGVLVAGCGDEFAKAKEIQPTEYTSFQTGETGQDNPAVNAFADGYKFSLTSQVEMKEDMDSKMTLKVQGEVAKLAEGAQVADMHYTVEYASELNFFGMEAKSSFKTEVTILNTKDGEQYVTTVYYTLGQEQLKMTFAEFSALLPELGSVGNPSQMEDPTVLVAYGYGVVQQAGSTLPALGQVMTGATYKKAESGKTTRFLVEKTDEPTAENYYTKNYVQYKTTYNEKQLSEVSLTNNMEQGDQEGKEVLVSTSTTTTLKGAKVVVSAPKNAENYKSANEE